MDKQKSDALSGSLNGFLPPAGMKRIHYAIRLYRKYSEKNVSRGSTT